MNTITITVERIPSSPEPSLEPTAVLLRAILRTAGLNVTKVEYSRITDVANLNYRSIVRKPKA